MMPSERKCKERTKLRKFCETCWGDSGKGRFSDHLSYSIQRCRATLSIMLQGKNLDLTKAANEPLVVINVLQEERDNEIVRNGLFERAKEMAAE